MRFSNCAFIILANSGGCVLSGFLQWLQRFFDDRELLILWGFLLLSFILLMTMGKILAPVLASIVIAYLLQTPVKWLQRFMPRLLAVCLAYCAFLGLFFAVMLFIWPLVFQQLMHLYAELPKMISEVQVYLNHLPDQYPSFMTKTTVDGWVDGFIIQMRDAGKIAFTASLATIPSVMVMIVYLFLVPLMVFFFMKDHTAIMQWCATFLPKQHRLLTKVWQDVDKQIVNYIRGKLLEFALVTVATYFVFYAFGLNYASLLAVLVGISVFIPYVGVILVTIPVVLVAFFEWGFGVYLAYFLLCYGIVQALDGAVLVPILFAEVVNLHPIAIIIAILVFGAWWGFWGVFFAIPLATVVKVIFDLRSPEYRVLIGPS